MMDAKSLKSLTAVVTGGGRGIGQAMVPGLDLSITVSTSEPKARAQCIR